MSRVGISAGTVAFDHYLANDIKVHVIQLSGLMDIVIFKMNSFFRCYSS